MKPSWLLLTGLALAACDADAPDARQGTVGKEIADDYNRALDEARDVELQMQNRVDSMEQSLQDAAAGTKDP